MTLEQAHDILKSPKWGDPQALLARARVHQEVEAEAIRRKVIGRLIFCLACDGASDGCKVCDANGLVTVTKEWADKMDLDALKSLMEELTDYDPA